MICRTFFSVLLIFATLSAGFTKLFIYAGYELNKDYIAKTLCVNKAKPTMHCNGKCYLTKKIKQAEHTEQKQEKSSYKRFFVEAFMPSTQRFICFTRQTDEFLPETIFPYSSIKIYGIFHPPQSLHPVSTLS